MKNSTKEILKLLLKISVVAAVMAVAIINYDSLTHIDIRQIVAGASSQGSAIAAIIGVYAVKGIVFVIPASLIYISVGMAFSPLAAVLINMAGITVEVIVSYLFGLFLGGEYVEKLLIKKEGGKKLLELKDKNKQSSVFIIRLLPIFPIDFASLFFGSVKFSFPKYLIFSVLGLAPRVIVLTILGDKIYDYIPMSLILKIIICLVPLAAVYFVIHWALKRRKEKK